MWINSVNCELLFNDLRDTLTSFAQQKRWFVDSVEQTAAQLD
jgi:hypothetical protein